MVGYVCPQMEITNHAVVCLYEERVHHLGAKTTCKQIGGNLYSIIYQMVSKMKNVISVGI